MMFDAVTNARVILFSVAFLASFHAFFWGNYMSDSHYYKEQRPALCIDGMRMGYSKSTAKFTGDDTDIHKGTVRYGCLFKVAVYPCYDTVDADTWNGYCEDLAEGPLDPWKVKQLQNVHRCVEPGAWGATLPNCDEKKFDCRDGPCDGYKKGLETCADQITGKTYMCWYTEEEEEIRTEAASFPVGWLIGGICISALGFCCCLGCIYSMIGEDNVAEKCFQTLAAIVCIVGLIVAISAIVRATKDDPKGPQETTYGDVYGHEEDYEGTGTTTPGPSASKDAPPPEPEGSNLAMYIGIGCGIGFLFITCAALVLIRAKRRGRDVRVRMNVPIESNFQVRMDLKKPQSSEPRTPGKKCAYHQIKGSHAECGFFGSQEAAPGEGFLCSQHFRMRVQELEKEAQLSVTDRVCHKILLESERTREFAQDTGARLGMGNKIGNVVVAKKVGKQWRQKARDSSLAKVAADPENPNQAENLS